MTTGPANFTVNQADLEFILKQIRVAEEHSLRVQAGEDSRTVLADILGPDFQIIPGGLRSVDGSLNNLLPGNEEYGAADNPFPRSLDPEYIADTGSDPFDANGPAPGGEVSNTDYSVNTPGPDSVVDSNPRTISNLIVDMTNTNPAAVAAWHANPLAVAAYQSTHGGAEPPADYIPSNEELAFLPNQSPDIGLSPGFNGWMTFFGQFFDHGLDLVTKGGNGSVYIPLQPDDPLYVEGGHANFMVLTRATPVIDPATGEVTSTNTTTSWIDQNQTYTSHASHQAFLREYTFTVDSDDDGTLDSGAESSGRLLDGAQPGAIANWGEVKAQALTMLGIKLDDMDVLNVPLLATDSYGELIRGPNGYAQIAMAPDATHATAWLKEGTAEGITTAGAIRTGHAFLDDIAATANPNGRGGPLAADANDTVGDHLAQLGDDGLPMAGGSGFYDNELLDAHFITGDGRGNENIGLTAVHTIFHSEHNRLVEANKATILASGDLAFINEWLIGDVTEVPTSADGLHWDGERLFQAAKLVTEMQYQHLVFEEFARKVQPNVDLFVFTNTPDIDPSITAEFAHVVYRFGHSMLTETVDRLDNNLNTVEGSDLGLIEAFLNPLEFTASGATVEEQTANIIRGMTRQLGNEIDEFVTEALRNNLLGLPLDLAALNMARAREQGVPSFNHARAQFFEQTGDAQLTPYTSWIDYAQNLKNPLSIVNFIAAYGTHDLITGETTLEGKRAAALAIVSGLDQVLDNGTPDDPTDDRVISAPSDRLDFLNARGVHAGGDKGGLDLVDFWIGGLAEEKMEFGGMLGSTFNFVFETQLENLQNGDRFYYLSRLQGTNLLNELEPNSFTALVMRNTDLGEHSATHLSGILFDTRDFILELDPDIKQITGLGADGSADPEHDDAFLQSIDPKVYRVNPGDDVDGDGRADGGILKFSGGEHVVLGGTEGNDTLIGDKGIDTLWGDGGNDFLNAASESDDVHGGDGDDIIIDPFGDDVLRGENGNDVISAGPGLDLAFGGDDKDFILAGADATEVFGGRGDDFILGGKDADTLLGNEGDDWIEGGDGFDGIAGDNSELFFNSPIIGHDVLWGQGNDTDYDGESGDDIMVSGPGIQRMDGMWGFDWAISKFDPAGANFDFFFRLATTIPADILRDRFDLVEAASGWMLNDTIRGDNRGSLVVAGDPVLEFTDHVLNQAGIDRITGFQDFLGAGVTSFRDGNILIGGDGNDLLQGRGGFDILDGDAWLNVRIHVADTDLSDGDDSFSVDSMNALTSRMLSGEINPGQLSIVREILYDQTPGNNTDTALFLGNFAEYTIEGRTIGAGGTVAAADLDGDGFITVTQVTPTTPLLTDDVDRVRNVEMLDFVDVDIRIGGTLGTPPASPLVTLNAINEDSGPRIFTPAQFGANAFLAVTDLQLTSGNGTLTVEPVSAALPLGGWRYTPAANDDTAATFVYTITDGVLSSSGSAQLEINPINDAPVVNLDPIVLTEINEDGGPRIIRADEILPYVTDVDTPQSGLTITGLTANRGTLVDNGDQTWTYTPNLNDTGRINLSFRVFDGVAQSAGARAALDLVPVDDAPVASPVTLTAIAEDSGARLITSAELLAGVTDVDTPAAGRSITALSIATGSGALVDNGDGTWTYTPAADDDSSVTFDYTASDGVLSSSSTASLDITAVNDAPVATLVALAPITEDSGARLITSAELLAGVTDVDTLAADRSITALSIATGSGALVDNGDGTWTYTPAANDDSSVTFDYTASDGFLSSSSSASLDITPVNDAPVAGPVTLAAIDQNSGAHLVTAAQLLAGVSDVDTPAASLGITAVSLAAGTLGTLVNNNNGTWTYTPAATDSSQAVLDYSVTDGEFVRSSTASMDITPVNRAPGGSISIGDLTPTEGQALPSTIAITDADGLPGAAGFARQWQASADGGATWTNIAGATGATFTPAQAQVGQILHLVVSYTDGLGTLETVTSAATGVVGDLFNGGAGNDTPTLTAGDDIASGNNGADLLRGLAGADVLNGGAGIDILNGGGGIDTLDGGLGNDRIIGGAGNDVLTGGAGSDVFQFEVGSARDRITDFDSNPAGGQDLIDIASFGFTAANFGAHVTLSNQAGATVVTIDGVASMTLTGVNAATVTVADFLLA